MRALSHALDVIITSAPIRYDHAVILPLTIQYVAQQMFALICIGAVDLIVGGHNALCPALFDSDLKACRVKFAEGSLVYHGVHRHTAFFL